MRRHKGQTVVIFAVSILGLLALAALGIDGANTYVQRRVAQNAADSASTTGARELALHLGENNAATERGILVSINKLAGANGIDLKGQPLNAINSDVEAYFLDSDGAITGAQIGTNNGVPVDAVGVTVRTRSDVPSILAQVVGRDIIGAGANADVSIYQAQQPSQSPGGGLMPIGVPDEIARNTHPYDLWTPQNDYTGGAQYKGLLDYNDVTGPGYVNDLSDDSMNKPDSENYWATYGYKGKIGKTDDVGLVNGDLGHNVSSGLQAFINAHPLYDDPSNPTAATKYGIIYVPVYQYPFPQGYPSGKIHVIGFAAFKLYYHDVSSSSAVGNWIDWVNLDGEPQSILTDPLNYRGPVTLRFNR